MEVYIPLIIFCYGCSFVNFKKLHKYVYWLTVLALSLISGFRYNVGTDFQIQINYYNWTVAGSTDDWLEAGFRLYINLIDRFFGAFEAYILIAAIFVVFSFGYTIYRNVERKYWFFSLSLFITSTIYFATMNLERQYIAIAFFIWAYEYLKEKKYIRVAIFTILAISFHSSAVCVLLFYALYIWMNAKGDANKRYRIVCVVMLISVVGIFVDIRGLIARVGIYIIPSRYLGYLSSSFFNTKDWDSILKFIVPNIVWFTWYFYLKKRDKDLDLENSMLGVFLWICINNFFYGVNVLLRIGMYFEWFLLLAFPKFIDKFTRGKNRVIIKILFLVYFLALTSYSIFYLNGHGVLPYQTIFEKG